MIETQMERVVMLNQMVSELVNKKLGHIKYSKGYDPHEPSDTEIRRMMLVLRRETLKLDKML